MKRIITILIVISLCISVFAGCQHNCDPIKFDFSYSVEKTKYARRETIQITATVTNVSGKAYRYVGCSGNDFIPFISLYNEIDGEKHYIECDPIALPTDVVNKKVKNGESGSITYSFVIPEDAKLGNYSLTLSLEGDKEEFADILSIVELTAQNETEKYRYSSTIVSSGNNNIQPIECFEGTTYYENGEPTTSGCGAGAYAVFEDPETKISDFPVLVCDGDITVTVPVNVTLGRIEVYDTSFQELEYTINDFSDLTALPYGEYLIAFSEQIDGRGCDAEIVDYWITDNENLFRLVIQEPSKNETKNKYATEYGYTEYEGIYLSAESFKGSGIQVIWHNDTDQEALRGETYHVERYNNIEWESVMVGEHSFEAIAVVLMPNTQSNKNYSLDGFDVNKEGTYRLRCEFHPAEGGTYSTWIEWEVAIEG